MAPGDDESAPDAEADAEAETGGELTAENHQLPDAGSDRRPDKGPLWRRITAWVLLVLACLLAVLSVVVVFARNQLLNTDAYVATMAPLASNPAIQTQLATRVSDGLIQRTDLDQRVKEALPPKAGFLADPITTQVKHATYSIALKAVQSEQFEKLWVGINRRSHTQLVNLLTGQTTAGVSTKGGRVTLNLAQLQVQVRKRLHERGITVFDKVPAVKATNYVLFQSEDLARVQKLVNALNKIAVLLPILAILLFAAVVALVRNHRRGLLRAALGLAVSMAVVLVALALIRNQYLSGVHPPQSPAAQAAVIDIVTATLRNTLRLVLLLSAIVALVAALAGNRWLRAKLGARQAPAWMTGGPAHDFVAAHRGVLQWIVLAIGLVVLVLWNNPTPLVALVVVLVTLAVVGLVGFWGRAARPVRPATAAGIDAGGHAAG